MLYPAISDWNRAYDNVAQVPDSHEYPLQWQQRAESFRGSCNKKLDIAYGESSRETFDLFTPQGKANGLCVFVHGGYWRRFDKSYFSHFAAGFVEAGWAVAIPSYQLCPHISIEGIQQQISSAVAEAAEMTSGPIILVGHSAGAQLVSMLVSENSSLPETTGKRVAHVVSISGVHDLRPLLSTDINADLKLDEHSAFCASPALQRPLAGTQLTALVGAAELPEFRRQNALLANVWHGLGARVQCLEIPEKHHFNVVDVLLEPGALVAELIGSV